MPDSNPIEPPEVPSRTNLIPVNGESRSNDEPPNAGGGQDFLAAMLAELPDGCSYFPDTRLINIMRDDGAFTPVCGPLRVTGYLRDTQGGDWRRKVEILDRDGSHRSIVLSEHDLAVAPGSACASLAAAGLDIRAPQRLLLRMLAEWPVEERIWTTSKAGWVTIPHLPRIYVTPAGQICTGATQSRARIELVCASPSSLPSGTLEGWRHGVGRMACGNPGLIAAISTALAGTLLDLAGIDTLGINLHARTSSGKTSALEAAQSCIGDPRELNRWNASNTAIEKITASANDGALILDEFPALPDRKIVEALYAIGNGMGRLRGQRDLTLQKTDRWNVALLSTSENPIHVQLAASHITMPEGLSVRLIDIPAASWAHGLFATLHEHSTPHSFATALVPEARTHHGHILPAFVSWLIDHEASVRRTIPGFLRSFRSSALEMINLPDQAPGPVMRVLDRLGLIATAGELGVAAGLLPWPRHMAWNAVLELAPLWFNDWSSPSIDEDVELVDRLKGHLSQARTSPTEEDAAFSGGWQDRRWIYLDTETFAFEVAGDIAPTEAARALRRMGILVPGNEARSLQSRLPSRFDPVRPRVYRFRRNHFG